MKNALPNRQNASRTDAASATYHASHFTFHVSRSYPLLLLLALLLFFFHKMAFSNLILARGDTFLYFYPYWQAAAEALRHGRVPLWNPHLFMGAPFLANSQVGFFYPLNWPLWLLLSSPYAVSASILLHLFIAGWGTYRLGQRALSLSGPAALLAAVLFALGGYLTAQVEHVNQLQGLAWLPWLLWRLEIGDWRLGFGDWRLEIGDWGLPGLRAAAVVGILFALQLLAGHTQTTFITGVAILLWLLAQLVATPNTHHASRITYHASRITHHVLRFFPLLAGIILAFLLTAIQLLPTLELAQLSSRQGGLAPNEVLSFSLHPLLLSRSLLPAYGQSLFSEYVAFLPLTALVLAFIGAWQWRQRPAVLAVLVLVVAGLLLALGVFNPLNWLLARLPGFNLFRVPARWLVLYALGMALLAGLGWQVVLERWPHRRRAVTAGIEGPPPNQPEVDQPLRMALLVLLALMAWSVIAAGLAPFIATGPEAPYEAPTLLTATGWAIELMWVYLIVSGRLTGFLRPKNFRMPVRMPLLLPVLAVLSLFLASRSQPYNNLTTPEAYFDLRPPITRLLVASRQDGEEQRSEGRGSQPLADSPTRRLADSPTRLLSLSDIFFDPGDLAEINTIYADQLPPAALRDYVVAVKQKEILAPNLPLAYGLSSVDGFDGGVLPLASYSQLIQLLLPSGVVTTDGRLREHLAAVPEARWLDLFNTRFLITDKTGDSWREGVFFDLQHPVTLTAGETVSVGYVPPFPATALWLIASAQPGPVEVTTDDGRTWRLSAEPMAGDLFRASLPEPATLHGVTLSPCHLVTPVTEGRPPCQVQGLTLVNERDQTFQPLVVGQYRLIHSGDVKIYENLDVLPRAFMLHEWQWRPDVASSVALMAEPEFDPRQSAVLVGAAASPPAPSQMSGAGEAVAIVHYEPERVILQTDSEAAALLLLTDAYYPGWQAAIDGEPAPVYQANGLFRGVVLPAGAHEVVFWFEPQSFAIGRVISLIGLAFLGLLAVFAAISTLRK